MTDLGLRIRAEDREQFCLEREEDDVVKARKKVCMKPFHLPVHYNIHPASPGISYDDTPYYLEVRHE